VLVTRTSGETICFDGGGECRSRLAALYEVGMAVVLDREKEGEDGGIGFKVKAMADGRPGA
jgi:hypothetical protein